MPFQSSCLLKGTRRRSVVVTHAASDPLLKKPAAPARPTAPSQQGVDAASGAGSTAAAAASASGVTLEYQRQQAKAMQQYFKAKKLDETIEQAKVFGWTKKNEILNGRWVMFGFAVGLLTEYATGVSFVDQIKMTISFLGIADVYD